MTPFVATIETDAFCEHCGFNLRTQPVWRDETLGILVCRCPECGRHHAAGTRTTAGNAWLRRAALAGLVAWLGVQIAFVLLLLLGLIGVQAIASDALTSGGYMTRDGRPVEMRNAGPNGQEFALDEENATFDLPAAHVVYGKRLAPWLTGRPAVASDSWHYATLAQTMMVGTMLAAMLVAASAVLASLAWFWRRGLMWLWLAVPIVATLVTFALIDQASPRGPVYGVGIVSAGPGTELRLAAGIGLATTLVTALGLAIGRPVARLVVSIFIPPQARQLFAFLWHCDGKTMPVIAARDTPR